MLRGCSCILKQIPKTRALFTSQIVGYKSQYNIETLYPNSSSDILGTTSQNYSKASEFSGYIPIEELDLRYTKSSGPGGQHVNKANTKVEARFHVDSASWIPDHIKANLAEQERSRITKDGIMIVTSEKTRKQILNQADCVNKIREMLWRASRPVHEPSPEEVALMNKRKEKAKLQILREKKSHSLKKQSRAKPNISSV